MIAFLFLICGICLLCLLDAYWRFYRTPRLLETARRTELALSNQRDACSKQLAACQERFDWYAGKSRDIVYQMSVPGASYTYVNQAAIDYHGFTRAEFLSKPMLIADMLHPAYQQVFADEWAKVIIDPDYQDARDFQIYNKHGELRWLHHDVRVVCDDARNPILLDGLVVDITDQKRTENALRESEANLRRAQEVAQLGIWQFDVARDTIACSPQAYRILDITPDTHIAPERFWELVHPEDREQVGTAWTAAFSGSPFDVEYRIVTATPGMVRWVYNRAEMEFNDDGTSRVALGVILDITGRKMLEAELMQAQRMEAIGRVAGGIAHDFNNTLSVILGYAEILSRRLEAHPEYKEEISSILDATERARGLVRQIVTYSRKVAPQRLPIDINHELNRLHEVWRRVLPRSIEIIMALDSGLPLVSADKGQVEQVLMNLATNAVDAMGGSGRMTVTTDALTLHEHRCTRCGTPMDGPMVRITVSDTGCGIPPENLDKIFDSFFTTKEPGLGTGLGLSSVLGIVERHGGHIECESVVDSGTRFHVYLPALSDQATEAPRPVEAHAEEPTGTETILLVDDEEDLRDINQAFLTSAGYTVITACNGKETLEQLQAHARQFDLILTDLNMPGMSVDAYIGGITALNPDAKIIAISGYFSIAEIAKKAPEGITSFLGKPYYRADLLRAVRDTLDNREQAPRHQAT